MNADAFRHVYAYHFSENRIIWDRYILPLSDEQFTQEVNYSVGSVRSQILHMMGADNIWFCEVRGLDIPDWPKPADYADRQAIRAHWDAIEQMMRAYLAALRDDMLFEKPVAEGEDKDLILWQILLHVVNHGTDHCAQLLRVLHDLGVRTTAQDYIFYVYDHPRRPGGSRTVST